MRRKALSLVLPCLLLLALPAAAPDPGGWYVLTVEDLPDHLVAGEPLELTYTVRAHGQRPFDGTEGRVVATSGAGVVEVASVHGERPGEHRARLTVPEPGHWSLTIRTRYLPPPRASARMPYSNRTLLPLQAVRAGEEPSPVSDAERGRRLFVAKGCVTCHKHGAVDGAGSVPVGPDLTERHFAAEYLALFLADPSIRPPSDERTFPMPDLDLDRTEIDRLTAFINADRATWAEASGTR